MHAPLAILLLLQFAGVRLLLERKHGPAVRGGTIGRVGARSVVWAEALTEAFAVSNRRSHVPPEFAHLFDFERLAPLGRKELTPRLLNDFEGTRVEVTLPGNPPIVARSLGSPRTRLLPWKVTVGAQSWTVEDLMIAEILAPLLPPLPIDETSSNDLFAAPRLGPVESLWDDPDLWWVPVGLPLQQASLRRR